MSDETLPQPISIEDKLAEYGLKVGPETLESLRASVVDLEAAASNVRRQRSYLEEPVHALRLWTK
jgi:hypothetical protein